MFDLETFRNLNDELKYELYKDLNMLVNLCYNRSRSNFIDFLEQLTLNIDNAFSVSNKSTLLGD